MSEEPHIPSVEFRRGLTLGLPIFLGYLPVGIAFGILANRYGFGLIAALVCSGTALAGAGQFIALATMVSGAGALMAIIATAVVNLRYVLFSATLSPFMRGVKARRMWWQAYTLTDESFAINVADLREGTGTLGSMAGVGVIAYVGWLCGTAIGWIGGTFIGDPTRFGIDFAMAAMFSALFVALAENAKQVACGIFAAAVVCALWLAAQMGLGLDANWFMILASLLGATVAMLVFSDDEPTGDRAGEIEPHGADLGTGTGHGDG
jgi:4-azaleucine resistance transporter AzlC